MEAKNLWEDAQRIENERRLKSAEFRSDWESLGKELFQPIQTALTELLPEIRKIKRATLTIDMNGADFKWSDSTGNGWIRIVAVALRCPGYENGGYSVIAESTESAFLPGKIDKSFGSTQAEDALKFFLCEISKLK